MSHPAKHASAAFFDSVSSDPRERRESHGAPSLELVVGDLVNEQADVLVSPAGGGHAPSSRVQLALRRTAGDALATAYEAAVANLPGRRIAVGENVVTAGFGLRCGHVVHCLPDAAPHDPDEARLALERCLRAAFDSCRRLGAHSVALPAIGTGAHGYRVSTVAAASVRCAAEAQRMPDGPRRVRFVLAGPATLEAFLHALSAQRGSLR